jgi:hypothetical protein
MDFVVVLKISGYIFLSSRTHAMPSMPQGKRLQFYMNPRVKDNKHFAQTEAHNGSPRFPEPIQRDSCVHL